MLGACGGDAVEGPYGNRLRKATLEILGRFTEELFALQRAIRTGDGDRLHDYFTRTRAIRRGIIEAGQDTDAPDFGRIRRKADG